MKWYLCVALIVVITASSGFCGNWHKRYDYDSAGEDDSSDDHWHHHFEDDEGSDSEEDKFGQDQDKFEQNGSGQLGKKGQGQPEQNGQDQEQENEKQPDQTEQDQSEQNGQGQLGPSRKNQQPGQSAGSSSENGGVQLSIPQQPRGQADTLNQCLKSCRVTTEFNPVCGSDNITYSNPGRLECAKSCGVDVSMLRTSSCNVPPPSSSTDNIVNIPKISKSSTPLSNVATEESVIDSAISLSNENSQSPPINVASASPDSAGLGTSTPVPLSSTSPDVSSNRDGSVGATSQTGSAVETSPVSIAVDGTAIQLSANTGAPITSTDTSAVSTNAALNSSVLDPSQLNADIFSSALSTVAPNA